MEEVQERSGVIRVKRANGEIEEVSVVFYLHTSFDPSGQILNWKIRYHPSITLDSGDCIMEMPHVMIPLEDSTAAWRNPRPLEPGEPSER